MTLLPVDVRSGNDQQEPGMRGLGVGGRAGDAFVPSLRDRGDEADDLHVGNTLWACVFNMRCA